MFLCKFSGTQKAIISHLLLNHQILDVYKNETGQGNLEHQDVLHCPNKKCSHKDSIYLRHMQFQLSLHTLINCKSTETRDRFLGDLVLMHCTDEDVIRDIEIKTQTIRDEMHIEQNKDMDIICGSDSFFTQQPINHF